MQTEHNNLEVELLVAIKRHERVKDYVWMEYHPGKLERKVFKLQNKSTKPLVVANEQSSLSSTTLIKSWAARTLATRQVSQDNSGKKTAGIDGLKSLT